MSNEKEHALGEYRGFSMSVMYNPLSQMYQLTLKGAMSHQVELGSDPRGNITRIDNALAGIPRRIQNVENKLNDLNQQMSTAKAELGKPFPQEIERNKGYLSGFEQDLATAAAHPLPEKDFM